MKIGVFCIKGDAGLTELIGTTQDVTERKMSEETLRKSEARYSEILENILVGVYQVTLDGKFLFANQKMIQMFGFSCYEELEAIGGIAQLYARPEGRAKVVDEMLMPEHIRLTNPWKKCFN